MYHHTLHDAVHGDDFTKWASEGGKKGGQKCKEEGIGFLGATSDQRKQWGLKGNQTQKELGVGVHAPGVREKSGRKAVDEKLGMFKDLEKSVKKAHEVMKERKTGIYTGDGKMSRKAGLTLFEDPDHPELGQHNAGNLVQKQKARGLPHGKQNRRRVK